MRLSPLALAVLALSLAVVGAGSPGVVADADVVGPTPTSDTPSSATTPDASPSVTTPDASTTVTTPDASTTVTTPDTSTPIDTPHGRRALPNETNRTNETRVLAIPEPAITGSGIERAVLDIGPATSFQTNVSEVRMETLAVEEYIEAAKTDEERSRRILTALSTIETRVITLNQREQEAIDAYSQGEITAETLAVRLAAIDAEAEALEDRLTMLSEEAKATEGFSLEGARVESIRFELRTFHGPVRERAAAALTGEAEPTRIFALTGPRGVVLTTIVNDTYVRESYRGALRNREGGSISASEALHVAAESYPTIWSNRLPGGVEATGSGDTFVAHIPYEGGDLIAYVDAGSKRVFKAIQRIPLSSYGDRPATTNVKSGLKLVVNRTYPGGPLRIHVEDADTGEPVDATVTISQGPEEGTVVGQTGADGTVWTLSPRGQFTVLAIRGQTAAVFVEVQPTNPPAVNR